MIIRSFSIIDLNFILFLPTHNIHLQEVNIYLREVMMFIAPSMHYNKEELTWNIQEIPKQKNAYDCGMFVCMVS